MRPALVPLRPLAIALAAGLALAGLVVEVWRLVAIDERLRLGGGLVVFLVLYASIGIGVARHSGLPRILAMIAVAAAVDAAILRGVGRVPLWVPLGTASLSPILLGLIAFRERRPEAEVIPEAPDTTCTTLLRSKRLRARSGVAKVGRGRPSPLSSLWDYWLDN